MHAQQLFDLSGEVALVTGASSGLGAHFAELLAQHGAKVVLAARRLDRIAKLAAHIGSNASAVELDVADRAALAGAFEQAERAFGTVTLLVNNAGIAVASRFLDTTVEEWDRICAINVDAVWLMAQEAARRMVAAGTGGSIVNIASILSFRVGKGESAYSVSKAAVAQMTSAMALDLARHQIRVNAIAPGYIVTEMTEKYLKSPEGERMIKFVPQRRAGLPSDLDGALLLLGSRKAGGFMTGSTIVVDGGHLCSFV